MMSHWIARILVSLGLAFLLFVPHPVSAQTCDPDTDDPVGNIVFPADLDCFGLDVHFLAVEDDFTDLCDTDLDRHYQPVPIPEVKLKLSPPVLNGRFGRAVASEGDTLVAAAIMSTKMGDAPQINTVVVFEKRGLEWIELQTIRASDGQHFDHFGASIALKGDWLAIGAPTARFQGYSDGAVYLFRRTEHGWVEHRKLLDPEGAEPLNFGHHLVLGDETLVVASDDLGRYPSTGAALVYTRSGENWAGPQRLETPGIGRDEYGYRVALGGGWLMVSAPATLGGHVPKGVIYAYRRNSLADWQVVQRIDPYFASEGLGFGSRMTLDGERLVVGIPNRHRVDVYSLQTEEFWDLEQFLFPIEGGAVKSFGCSVQITGETIAVGACDDPQLGFDVGSIYQYTRGTGGWEPLRKWLPSDPARNLRFGSALIATEDRLITGTPNEDTAVRDSGAIYVLEEGPANVYRRHGNYDVSVIAVDDAGNEGMDSVRFVLDKVPPVVHIIDLPKEIVIPQVTPFTSLFGTSDDDDALGDVVYERVLLDDCRVFDGFDYGNGDGLLNDESLTFDRATLCAALTRCSRTEFSEPVVTLYAEDCGGNATEASRRTRFDVAVHASDCP